MTSWVSDRQLKALDFGTFNYRKSRDSTPDAIYKSVAGKTIAFEYEIAQKSKKRYDDKIHRYVSAIRQRGLNDEPTYHHVRIVCEKPAVQKLLLNRTRIYAQYFTIELAEEFFGRFRNQDLVAHCVTAPVIQ